MLVIRMILHILKSCIQKTGTSKSKSLTVPPPTEVINAIMITPKGSSRFCIAAKLPDIAKATVPRTSIMKLNCSCIKRAYFNSTTTGQWSECLTSGRITALLIFSFNGSETEL